MLDVQTISVLTLPSVPFAERVGLPGCPAIYFVLNVHGTVLYIGCSVNLAERWRAHNQARKLTDEGATRIAWLVIDDVGLLTGLEAACIAYFEPVCNASAGGYPRDPHAMGEPLVTLSGRLPLSVLARIDAYVESMRLATPGLNIGRSDAFRILLVEGLDAVSRSADITDTVTETTVTDPSQLWRMIQAELRDVAARAEGMIAAIDTAEQGTGTVPDTVTDTVTDTEARQKPPRRRKRQTAPAD